MLIKRRSFHHPTEQDVTPEAVYQDRRLILKGLGLSAATLAFPAQAGVLDLFSADKPTLGATTRPLNIHAATRPEGVIITPEEKATTHNNFYELGTDKGDPARNGHYLKPEPWTLKERLSLEKTAIGFYLSGHLFDEAEAEVRRFARQRIGDLKDSRDPQVVAGIISDLRVINGARGRVAIFKLDDKSETIEAVANQETLDANKDLLKDDELVIIQGKVQTDRFSGGLRLNVQQVFSVAAARCRYARFVRVKATDQHCPVQDLLREFPTRRVPASQPDLPDAVQGLPLRVVVERHTPDLSARAELELGDLSKFFPSDQALQRLKELMPQGQPTLVYGEG